jgi:CDP-4-dehydro-6-deoxyglucose reductase
MHPAERGTPERPAWPVPDPDAEPDVVRVTVLPDDVRVEIRPDETILAALGRAGLRYRIGCRRGGCGVCKLHLRLGEVRYSRPVADSVLTDDERVEGICLSCRAVPLTNVVVELQEGDRLRRVLQLGFTSGSSTGAAPRRVPEGSQGPAARRNARTEQARTEQGSTTTAGRGTPR